MTTRLGWGLVASTLLAGTGCIAKAPPEEQVGSSQSAMTVCGDTSVKGMDVSHYDGTIDWPTAHSAGVDFAFVKATESTDFVDPMFATNWPAMKAAGVVRGAYHFFHADVDPVAQANYVMMTVGKLEPGDLPVVLDLETTNGETEATIAARATTFLDTVTKDTGLTAILYVSPSFLSDYSTFGPYSLWVANWGVKCPDVPAPWSTWSFWQYSSTGSVSGVPSSGVDLNYFNGTLAELKSLGGGGMPEAGPPDTGTVADSGGTKPDSGGVVPMPDSGGVKPPADAGTPHSDSGGEGGGGGHTGASSGWGNTREGGGCSVGSGARTRGWGASAFSLVYLAGLLIAARRKRAR